MLNRHITAFQTHYLHFIVRDKLFSCVSVGLLKCFTLWRGKGIQKGIQPRARWRLPDRTNCFYIFSFISGGTLRSDSKICLIVVVCKEWRVLISGWKEWTCALLCAMVHWGQFAFSLPRAAAQCSVCACEHVFLGGKPAQKSCSHSSTTLSPGRQS